MVYVLRHEYFFNMFWIKTGIIYNEEGVGDGTVGLSVGVEGTLLTKSVVLPRSR